MKEYLIQFDELCNSILLNGNQNAYDELRNARLYINGMTDGWFEFVIAFEKALAKHKIQDEETKTARILIDFLRNRLEK
jgi:hypothetical protein